MITDKIPWYGFFNIERIKVLKEHEVKE